MGGVTEIAGARVPAHYLLIIAVTATVSLLMAWFFREREGCRGVRQYRSARGRG